MSENGISLRGKLIATTVATMLALVVLFVALLIGGKARMLQEREYKLRNLVETAYATLTYFEKEARDGRLSVDDAKKGAKEAVKGMRYDKVEYFWINDLQDTMIMHPIKPDLDGKKLDQLKDKNGKLLFLEFNKVVRAQGGGLSTTSGRSQVPRRGCPRFPTSRVSSPGAGSSAPVSISTTSMPPSAPTPPSCC